MKSRDIDRHNVESGISMDIMMMLDTAKVLSLRKEFQEKEKGLSMDEFVYVMKKFIVSGGNVSNEDAMDETELVANLCDLFAQV